MPEIAATLNAMYESERRKQKFMAALQGVDLDEKIDKDIDERVSTLEEVKARAAARLTGDQNVAGAISQGITSDMGTQYKLMGGAEIG
jgi:ribosomal protein L12E/L44/L45/RPP1/RPP2